MGDRLVVIGAGVMGHGIAQIGAMAGYETVLVDLDARVLEHALGAVRRNLDEGVARGKVDEETRERALSGLRTSTSLQAEVPGAAYVIEAVPEDLGLKQRLFAELDALAGPEADVVLGTNTSSLSVARIAQATSRPERVIGTHFFNPPHILRLLEIVRPPGTSEATLERTRALGQRTGREMIVVDDSPGFATSRLGLVLGLEAIRMLESGVASAEDIDRAMELGYRHPMGPLRLTDLVGLDTRLRIAEYLHEELESEAFRPPALLRRLVAEGRLGRKSGQGFYDWS